jgi:hypothetical protein
MPRKGRALEQLVAEFERVLARQLAAAKGIDLRTIATVTGREVFAWLLLETIRYRNWNMDYRMIRFGVEGARARRSNRRWPRHSAPPTRASSRSLCAAVMETLCPLTTC